MAELKLNFDISKRFMVFLFIVGIFSISYAGNGQFNLPLAWVLGDGDNSVDMNANGIIDMSDDSDKLDGLDSTDFLNAAGAGGGGVDAFCVANTQAGFVYDIDVPGYARYDGMKGSCYKRLPSNVYTHKRMFMTSIIYDGAQVGGEAGADAKCQNRADVAGLGGNFKAFLLDGTGDLNIFDKFEDASYYNMKGQVVLVSFLDKYGTNAGFKQLLRTIQYDEFGRTSPSTHAWTGLEIDGDFYPDRSCVSFTSNNVANTGEVAVHMDLGVGAYWYANTVFGCEGQHSIVCVET